jgi:hypothetical protein
LRRQTRPTSLNECPRESPLMLNSAHADPVDMPTNMKPKKQQRNSMRGRSTDRTPSRKAKWNPVHPSSSTDAQAKKAPAPQSQGRPHVHLSYEGPESDVSKLPVPKRPDLTRLKKFLLTYAGSRFQRNDYLVEALSQKVTKQLAQEGRFFPGNKAILFKMLPSQCDANSELLGADSRVEKWVGFALDDDPCWRLHCWLVRRKDGRLIETTVKRTLYFGVRVKKLYASNRIGRLAHVRALFNADPDTETSST